MRYPFIRRAVALALALFLALTLSISLTAPGRAAGESSDSPSEETSTSPDPETSASPAPTAPAAPALSISGSSTTTVDSGAALTYTATLSNAPAGAEIQWSEARKTGQTGTILPVKSEPKVERSADGTLSSTVTYTCGGAGEFIITATDGDQIATRSVTVSGLALSGNKLTIEKDEKTGAESYVVTMFVNGSTTLVATPYGAAADRNSTSAKVYWSSSDPSVVSVMNNGGNLNAWGVGKAIVTAIKGKYTVDCDVVVNEDTDVIADKDLDNKVFTASFSEPLNFLDDGVYARLEAICLKKTDDISSESPLKYITNLKVSPDQGTLYYSYSTESDTGDGVGYSDQFARTAKGAVRGVNRLYFVPTQGFSGTAEITFSGIAESGQNFAGAIRVNVTTGSGSSDGEEYQISYRTRAGEPAWFQADDFSLFCQQNKNSGRDFNYIIFSLPKSSEGMLYYNYVAGSGNAVTTSLQFTKTGRYAVDDVCFVPNAAYNGGAVTIRFRAIDTAGATIDGAVTVNVIPDSDDDPASVSITGGRGQPTALQSELFNAACQATINDTLSFVTFKLPDPDVGALYVNYQSENVYDSRVTAGTRCYYSGTPGLNSVSFVPASGVTGRVAIQYTGYGSGGASYGGTLYIMLDDSDRSTIYYSVPQGDSVTFSAYDFNAAGQYAVGSNVSFVVFTDISDKSLGTLYCKTGTNSNITSTVSYSEKANNFGASYVYYVSPSTTSQRGLSRVYFDTKNAKNSMGAVTISYTAFSGTTSKPVTLFTGKVEIQIGALSPDDINLSCKLSGQARLSATTVNYVCSAVMSGSLSHIEITSVPSAEQGHLYYNFSGFGTGKEVKQGDRYYRVGSYNINQLTFVPHAGFTGDAEITYIGYNGDGQQVSGRIIVNVSKTKPSQYFNDMGGHSWAIDAVDYLYRNGAVKGTGSGRFSPNGTITRGDFALILIRAYGFTASGSSPFRDVPSGSYYADAIRIAYQLGIVENSNGYFRPKEALTRQDAMVMIYNALKVSGKTTTNGLAADFSVYRDANDIAAYAREAMGSLIQMGVVKGVGNGYLRPQRQLTRAESAVLMHTIMTM